MEKLTEILMTVLEMSFTASLIIIAVIFARIILKKTPKIFSYFLWIVVLFRLVCPFSFESFVSVVPAEPIVNYSQEQPNFLEYNNDFTGYEKSPEIIQPKPVIDVSPSQETEKTTEKANFDLGEFLTYSAVTLWISVGIFMIIFSFVKLYKLKNSLANAIEIEKNIFSSDKIETAFVLGIFSPKIYLTAGISPEEHEFILLHEKTHIKRFDHILRIISYFVLCLHWFNPLVWVAYILSGKDMEMSCDEAVIKKLGCKKEYAKSLLSLATKKKIISPLSFGEGDTKARVKNILSYKKPSFWVIIVAVLAVAVAIFIFASNPISEEDEKKAETPVTTEITKETAVSDDENTVTFKEIAVENAVKEELAENGKSLTKSNLELVTVINLNNAEISTFEDLKLFPNLERVLAANCNISDLSEFSSLKSLRVLSLAENKITDLSPLSTLNNLNYLDVSNNYYSNKSTGGGNNITDLSPISNLANLTTLKIDGNGLSDISPLENLTKLRVFEAQGNNISDLTPLSNLTNFDRVYLADNNISDISPLANLSENATLNIRFNSFTDWSPVSHVYSTWDSMVDYNNLIDSTPYTASADEISEIQNLFVNYRDFTDTYFFKMPIGSANELLDFSDSIVERIQYYNLYGMPTSTYERNMYRLVDGEITTPKDFTDKLHSIYTDENAERHEEYYTDGVDYYKAVDDKLYAFNYGGAGFQGYSTTFISNIGKLTDDRYVVYFTSIGDYEGWSFENDKYAKCYFILEKTANGFRIDECSLGTTLVTHTYNPEDDFSMQSEIANTQTRIFTDEEIASYLIYEADPEKHGIEKPDYTMDTSFVNNEQNMQKIISGFMNDDFSDETAIYYGVKTSPHYPNTMVYKIYFEDNTPHLKSSFSEGVLVENDYEINTVYDTPLAYVFTTKDENAFSILKQDFRYVDIKDSEKSVEDYGDSVELATENVLKLLSTLQNSPDGKNKINGSGLLIYTNFDDLKPSEDYRTEVSVVEILDKEYFKINLMLKVMSSNIPVAVYYVGCENQNDIFSASEVDGALMPHVFTSYSVYSKIQG